MTARAVSPMTFSAAPGASMAVAAMVSMQLATALSRPLTQEIGAPALTALRMATAAVLLLVLVRPRLAGLSPQALWAAILLGGTLGLMSLASFAAAARLPIGLVATVAFLGPLAVSVLGAGAARMRAVGLAGLALAGVVLMVMPGAGGAGGIGWQVDPLGLVLAVLAAIGWAAYILLTRRVGQLFKGTDGLCLSLATAAVMLAPVGLSDLASAGHAPDWTVLLGAASLGLLAPCLTCWLEMKALRGLGVQSFGIMMSLEPAVATLLGLAILHEVPSPAQLIGMTCVTIASSAAVFLPSAKAATT